MHLRSLARQEAKERSVKQFTGSGRINIVRKASQFASIALSIVVVALPLSACLTSFAEMSAEQRECCEKMAGRAGSLNGISSSVEARVIHCAKLHSGLPVRTTTVLCGGRF